MSEKTITADELRALADDPNCDARSFMRCKMREAANTIEAAQQRVARLEGLLLHLSKEVRVRIAFIGMPQEPPNWRDVITLCEAAEAAGGE